MHSVHVSQLSTMSDHEANGMFRLRYDTFHTRLGWDVSVVNQMERDRFDEASTVYIIGKSETESVDACWRLLPTLGPYMLKNVFPELLHGQVAPAAHDIWELSRFAIATDRVSSHGAGLGELSVSLMAESARFALERGITRYVTVTTTAIERLLKYQGLHIHRIGPPIKIGLVMTVACIIEVDAMTLKAVGLSHT